MTTIYLSSTYEDLADYRQTVYQALRKSGYEVIAMEDYVATDSRPLDKCLRDIAERKPIYVGVFAFRYGYVPPPEQVREGPHTRGHADWEGLSITELEFRYAGLIGCPCLVFVAKEKTNWNTAHIDALTEKNTEHPGRRIENLRRYLLAEKTAGEFSSAHELASLVQAAVTQYLKEAAARGAATERPSPPPVITWDIGPDGSRSPYPGLMHFTRFYAPVFFGREAEVRKILDRMKDPGMRFLLVSGDSGVGKSSVVDAGVLPRLEAGGLPGGKGGRCVRMVPSQGGDPFEALALALKHLAEQAGGDADALGKRLQKPADLPAVLADLTAGGAPLVLFLDQMEELFTGRAREQAGSFVAALSAAARKGALWVVATIRSDHLHHCHRHPDLLEVLDGPGHCPIGPVDAITMADMIRKPARCAGLEIGEDLVRRIVQETGAEPGSLPLLSFVLQQLFLKRTDRTLSAEVYDGFGGVAGAIGQHAETVEADLCREFGAAADDLLPTLFRSLLEVKAREGLPTRRRTRLADLTGDLAKLVDRLIKERLLCTEGRGLESTVGVTHERLFEAWPSLARWIALNKDDLWLRRQIGLAAVEWEKAPQETDKAKHLWPDERILDVAAMAARLGLSAKDFTPAEQAFLGPYDRDAMLAELDDPATPHLLRATIGRRLSLLGDPRPGVGLRADGLPDLVWCKVDGGTVTLEIERTGRLERLLGGTRNETFPVRPFSIAKYPVTWVQYRAFLKAPDGFGNPAWWEGCPYNIDKPGRQFSQYDNHPAENLCWFEALAFCRWLSDRLGCEIDLPTEWQWQQAATGGKSENVYPWGEAWDDGRANTDESELGRTTAVGMYPHGASPVGALDMAGNVWEWCRNEFERPGRAGPTGEARRVVRGGSCVNGPSDARAAFRDHFTPFDRGSNIGFRVVCASPIS